MEGEVEMGEVKERGKVADQAGAREREIRPTMYGSTITAKEESCTQPRRRTGARCAESGRLHARALAGTPRLLHSKNVCFIPGRRLRASGLDRKRTDQSRPPPAQPGVAQTARADSGRYCRRPVKWRRHENATESLPHSFSPSLFLFCGAKEIFSLSSFFPLRLDLRPGVNFINILHEAFYEHRSKRRKKCSQTVRPFCA